MKYKNSISILVLCISAFALIAAVYGVFSNQGQGTHEFKSVHNQIISIYGKGLYQNDSVSMASQAIAQDIVTIILGIPLLLGSLILTRRGLLKGKLLLAGTLGYFLYTYMSYSFYSMYNQMFLIDVLLMSASFFAFTMTMMSFDLENLSLCFNQKLPVKFVGGVLIFISAAIGLMWLKVIISPLVNGTFPLVLEHYTSLVIQALDLGFVVPVSILSGVLLIKRRPLGFLLASVIAVKEVTMLTVTTAMIIGQAIAGVKMSFVEMAMFPIFNIVLIFCTYLILKNIVEPGIKKSEMYSKK